jgi:hypothetical protein
VDAGVDRGGDAGSRVVVPMGSDVVVEPGVPLPNNRPPRPPRIRPPTVSGRSGVLPGVVSGTVDPLGLLDAAGSLVVDPPEVVVDPPGAVVDPPEVVVEPGALAGVVPPPPDVVPGVDEPPGGGVLPVGVGGVLPPGSPGGTEPPPSGGAVPAAPPPALPGGRGTLRLIGNFPPPMHGGTEAPHVVHSTVSVVL